MRADKITRKLLWTGQRESRRFVGEGEGKSYIGSWGVGTVAFHNEGIRVGGPRKR